MDDLDALVARLEQALARHRPDLLADLNPPATEADLAALQAALGQPLPDGLRRWLARHDGQRAAAGGLFEDGGHEALSARGILAQWSLWARMLDEGRFASRLAEAAPGVRAAWWDRGWVPFTHDGAGSHLCLDLAPAEGGTPGQVIAVAGDGPAREVRAVSLQAWLAQAIDRIGAG
ncbi:MAG: hypothetical protein RL456_2059 [Pseudomonadota bacterium]|jgi:cell wall assembly regulator SMI1